MSALLFAEAAQGAKDPGVRKRALYNLGNSLMKLGDPTQALAAYQLALDTKAANGKFDKEANQRISDNIVLAVKMEQEQRRKQKEKQQGEGNDEPKDGESDPQGPKQFQAQQFDDQQKQRMFDLVSGEEQQILQRLQSKKSKDPKNPSNGKEW
jgi:hypothetical protein